MRLKQLPLLFCTFIFLVGCGTLHPAVITSSMPLNGYSYAFVTPTSDKVGTSGVVIGNQYGIYGGTSTKSSNPSELISGYLMKKGFIISPDIRDDISDKTIIVSYGETGRRTCGLGYAIEITIQILNAKTRQVICTCTAEGKGETEADDIRIAISRCLDKIFE